MGYAVPGNPGHLENDAYAGLGLTGLVCHWHYRQAIMQLYEQYMQL